MFTGMNKKKTKKSLAKPRGRAKGRSKGLSSKDSDDLMFNLLMGGSGSDNI